MEIFGLNTNIFTWANASKCDSCGTEHDRSIIPGNVRWFKGELFGKSPHTRGDIALCKDCAEILRQIVKDTTEAVCKLQRGMLARRGGS